MTKRLTLAQLKKYDINQKVLEALTDAQSRAIVFSIIKEGKTAADLAEEHKIPLSSVYKKISELEELSLIKVEKWILSDNGRKFKLYRSRISKADVNIRKPDPVIILSPNLLSRVS